MRVAALHARNDSAAARLRIEAQRDPGQPVADLLRLSTLESAPEAPADERVDVRVLLARIRTDAEVLSAGRHRIVLEADHGFDLLGVEREIASAFGNLAGNAVRYTPPGGVVRLVWRASPKGAAFSVEDTG